MVPKLRARINRIVGREIVYILRRSYAVRNRNLAREIARLLDVVSPPSPQETADAEIIVDDTVDATVPLHDPISPDVVDLLTQSIDRLLTQHRSSDESDK